MYRYSQFIFKREINWLQSHFYMILFLVKKCVCVPVHVCAWLYVVLTGKNKWQNRYKCDLGGGGAHIKDGSL